MEVLSKTLGFWDQVSSYTSRVGIREYAAITASRANARFLILRTESRCCGRARAREVGMRDTRWERSVITQ